LLVALEYQFADTHGLVVTPKLTVPYPQRLPGTVDAIVGVSTYTITEPEAEFPHASVTLIV
jgi:hypothetical protein